MAEFSTIARMLRTAYSAEDGLGEDASVRLYWRAAASGANRAKLEAELREAFARDGLPG